eukprot:6214211-Pleurochrysis_carterae.AAC.2
MAGSEALAAAVSCCVVQRCCKSCSNVNSATRSSEDPCEGSCEGKIHKPWYRARRNGYSEDGRVNKAQRVQSSGVEHSSEGRTVPSRKAARPQEELLP